MNFIKRIRQLGFLFNRSLLIIRLLKNYFKLIVLKKKVLRNVEIALGYNCQCNCSHCYAYKFYNSAKKVLNTKQVKKIIDECLNLGAIHINFTGGEPLLRKDIYELIKYAKPYKTIISIDTNGILLTERKIKKLKEAGLSLILISLDSPIAEEHNKNRGIKDSFEKVLNAIKYSKKNNMKVMINTVLTHEMMSNGRVWDLIKLAKKLDLIISIVTPCAVGKWLDKNDVLWDNDDLKLFKKLLKYPFIRNDLESNYLKLGCGAGIEKIGITAYGDVLPCPVIPISFGNVMKEPLGTIWKRIYKTQTFNNMYPMCRGGEKKFINKFIKPIGDKDKMPISANKHNIFRKMVSNNEF